MGDATSYTGKNDSHIETYVWFNLDETKRIELKCGPGEYGTQWAIKGEFTVKQPDRPPNRRPQRATLCVRQRRHLSRACWSRSPWSSLCQGGR